MPRAADYIAIAITLSLHKRAKPLKFDSAAFDLALSREHCPVAGRVHWFDQIPSTNDFISDHEDAHQRLCLAGLQTAGRGRRGKQWLAPIGSSVLMSLGWQFCSSDLGGLPLVCGLAVKQALAVMGVSDVTLKWPNDILLGGEKLAGILVEASGKTAVIGIGLNVSFAGSSDSSQLPSATTIPWTDLQSRGYQVATADLAASMVVELSRTLARYDGNGFAGYISDWNAAHHFHRQQVVLQGVETVSGMVQGIDHIGGLVLEQDGVERVFYSGEVSMRPIEALH